MNAAQRRLARDRNLTAAVLEAEGLLDNASRQGFSRRSFIKLAGLAGGGLTLGFQLGAPSIAQSQEAGGDFAPNAFLKISTDGSILIYNKNPEVGQGIKTAFPMIVAEELDADWNDVLVEQSPISEAIYGRQAAGGSRSVPSSWDQLREAGATARAMLVSAAAAEWNVPVAECSTADSMVTHDPTGRQLGYGELANAAAALPVPAASALTLKSRSDYRLIGRRIGGVDNEKIVTGQPLFGIDTTMPDMVYASYSKCPATGGRVRSANLDEIRALPGVQDAFVIDGNDTVTELMPGIAIIGNSTWATQQARASLRVDWDESEASKDSWSGLAEQARALSSQPGNETVREFGNVDDAFDAADQTLEAFYSYPFVSHAPLEPQNCAAWYRDGRIEIWAPSQTPQRAIQNVANVLGIAEDNITLHQTRIGGGFGRRLMNDYVCEVAAIARQVGVPVKLQWAREDDMAHDFYRPGGFHALKASLDNAGRLSGWADHFITFTHDGRRPVSGGEARGGEFPEGLAENYRMTQTMLPLATPTGPWRAPRSNAIAFAVQSFHHEIAVAAGRDHLEFLLEIMGEPRWLEEGNANALHTGRAAAVIRLAAERAGWGQALPPGRGLGLAFYFSHAGHFAEVADVSVDGDRRLTVNKVTVAGDVGPIVNLSGAENQCQGAVMDGLSTMLGLEITMEGGRVQESNFHQYPLMRMNNAPIVDVHFIESDFAPTGLGEPALPPLAPAVCNAIFAATGHRVRTLPLSKNGFYV
ncbi:MAG TPA: molybdopterin cofactor-binding domain-containing protein [Gammaproteobacteria bacterium]